MKKPSIFFILFLFSSSFAFSQFKLPTLSFQYADLEPYIDSTTVRIHLTAHHAAYVNNLNKTLEKYPKFAKWDIIDLLKNINKLPADIQTSVRNNGGGYYNHNFYWQILAPANTTKMSAEFENAIEKSFGSIDKFKENFEKAALDRFGSGWVWLLKKPDGSLFITSFPNQDNMFMPYNSVKGKPILTLDVWEHAYYLKYQSKRAAYAKAFWNVVNWNKVSELYAN